MFTFLYFFDNYSKEGNRESFNNFHETANTLCIPESYNMKISYQLFDFKVTFVNSQHKNTNSEGEFVLK